MPEQRPAFIAMTCWIKRCYWFDNYERRLEIYLNRELRQTMQSAASSSTSALDPRLVTGETACQLQTGCPRVSVKMRNTTAQYLVEDCQLVSNTGRRRLWSADVDTYIMPLTRTRVLMTGVSRLLAPVAGGCEQFTSWVASAGRRDRTVLQTASEDVSVLATLGHIATFLSIGALEAYLLTYLVINQSIDRSIIRVALTAN